MATGYSAQASHATNLMDRNINHHTRLSLHRPGALVSTVVNKLYPPTKDPSGIDQFRHCESATTAIKQRGYSRRHAFRGERYYHFDEHSCFSSSIECAGRTVELRTKCPLHVYLIWRRFEINGASELSGGSFDARQENT